MDLTEFIEQSFVDIPAGTIFTISGRSYISKKIRIPDYYRLCNVADTDSDDLCPQQLVLHEGYTYPVLHMEGEIFIGDIQVPLENIINDITQFKIKKNGNIVNPSNVLIDIPLPYKSNIYSILECNVDIACISIFDTDTVSLTKRYEIDGIPFEESGVMGFFPSDYDKGTNYKKEIRYECGGIIVEEKSTFKAITIK